MNLLLDTNILFNLAKHDDGYLLMDQAINPDKKKVYTSIVSVAELKSLAIKNKWGAKKWEWVDRLLLKVIFIEINESLVNTYAEIDAYSQRRNPVYQTYPFDTPRNMGKNDLWIASTAALLGLKLVTTDQDFSHLHNVFLEVELVTPTSFNQ